jgi:uncharacterized protein YbcC (UPF0753/DUF2309 family)
MSLHAHPFHSHDCTAPATPDVAPVTLQDMVERAGGRIAPLWPIQHFVAVNPFLGLTNHSFAAAAQLVARAAGARMTMPRAFYRKAMADGRIRDKDLALALQQNDSTDALPEDIDALKRRVQASESSAPRPLATAADAASQATGYDWAALAAEQISLWAASHFDQGQALWLSPSRHLGPYAAWREHARIDRTPQIMGLTGFRKIVKALPDTAEAMIREGVARLQIPESGLADYLHRLLMSMDGWAGYARYRGWQSELHQRSDSTLMELLAVRLAWDVAILASFEDHEAVATQWTQARGQLQPPGPVDAERALDHLLQLAYEIGWQRGMLDQLRTPPQAPKTTRKAVQAAFCIDVRSEVFRRALESESPAIDTLGVAGFFGMPIEFVPLGHAHGGAQCPALITPAVRVRERVKAASSQEESGFVHLRQLRLRVSASWRWFKLAAVSSFAFVETMGWIYLGKLVTDGFGFSRPVPHPATDGIDDHLIPRLAPDITPASDHGHASGLPLDTRVQLAEGALKAMSLRQDFARLVVLAGHAATSINNPHASGLDCGACGGHSGEANARVAATVLNDPHVRKELSARGMPIPEDTWFVGALHNTTTDALTLFDTEDLPATHAGDLEQLQVWAEAAGERTRIERAGGLNLRRAGAVHAQIMARSRDWSQVRPEWGLAGCAAFVVAPRHRTAHLDLQGRAFLNSYDWRQDQDFAVLESIMTAPMIVGSWINLQYYGSTVDNTAFGCGNKVLHNVVGKLGVLEGNGGNLRTGLPLQSLHDGQRWVHEPLRLSVVIAAPIDAINALIAKHEAVRELVDNGWIHLFAMPDQPGPLKRYCGALQWQATA